MNPNVQIDQIGGQCPVQAEGTIYGHPFYFRARGEQWSIGIGGEPVTAPIWDRCEPWGSWPEAGYMPEEEAIRLIYETADMFRRWMMGAA
jgi:hypothetical protein